MFRDTTRFVLVGYLTMFTVAFEAVPSTPLAPRNSYRKRSSGIQPNSSWIGDTADQPTFHHGMTATFGGEEYILHQVHATAFWGIRPEDWDDSIRVMNNTDWSLDEVNTSLVAREIDDRDLVTGLCHAYESCISYAQSGIVTIGDVAPQYFESLRAVANSVVTGGVNGIKSVNQILNDQPFICQVVASSIAGIAVDRFSAWVGGKTSGDNDNIQACSTIGDQIDALKSIILSQSTCFGTPSMTATAQLDDAGDEISSITMTTITCGAALPANECGLTAGFCTSTATS